jgi:hypothetical protein
MEIINYLLPLLGKRIDSNEITSLFAEWGVVYPKTITCTANNDTIRTKMEQNGIKIYFGRGGNSRYLKPQPSQRKGSYTALFALIEFLPKYTRPMPFNLRPEMEDSELNLILGEPKVVNFVGETTTWRKPYKDIYELIVSKTTWSDGKETKSITLGFLYEPDLYTLEDYETLANKSERSMA